MIASEFPVFYTLLNEVHNKAFGEPLTHLPHGKAQALSWFIEETTGYMLSYKTLGKYVDAALRKEPASVNPNTATLGILLEYAQGQKCENPAAAWFEFRAQVLRSRVKSQDQAA